MRLCHPRMETRGRCPLDPRSCGGPFACGGFLFPFYLLFLLSSQWECECECECEGEWECECEGEGECECVGGAFSCVPPQRALASH